MSWGPEGSFLGSHDCAPERSACPMQNVHSANVVCCEVLSRPLIEVQVAWLEPEHCCAQTGSNDE